jgi:hypothetical protein
VQDSRGLVNVEYGLRVQFRLEEGLDSIELIYSIASSYRYRNSYTEALYRGNIGVEFRYGYVISLEIPVDYKTGLILSSSVSVSFSYKDPLNREDLLVTRHSGL